MKDRIEKLTNLLLEVNDSLSYAQAQDWVELLWSDMEATYAKVGKYNGPEATERTVETWIKQHGGRLHLVQTNNPKYKHLINRDDYLQH